MLPTALCAILLISNGFPEGPMTGKNYARLAALIFSIVAVLQLALAVSGLPVTLGTGRQSPYGPVGLLAL